MLNVPKGESARSSEPPLREVVAKKIVGLVPARNESKIIGQCLRALSLHTDAIIFLDDCSGDDTVQVVQSLESECSIERVIQMTKWHRDEPGDRNALLQAGREIGGTHFIALDADEMFTANCTRDGFLRNFILSLKPGDQLYCNWIQLWRSVQQYRFDSSVWTWNYKGIIFADDGKCFYRSDFIHTSRIPPNLGGKKYTIAGYRYGLLHFQFVNWRNLLIKQAWYRCLERLRCPEKRAAVINELYAPSKNEENLVLATALPQWLEGYRFFDPSSYWEPETWRERQVLGWFSEKGRSCFADLDIWDIEWGQGVSREQDLNRQHSAGLSFAETQDLEALAGKEALDEVQVSSPAPDSRILVSAIVSTYNAERFLRGCLEDLEAQTIAARLEIIVVDSGSRQNEQAIVEEFQRRYNNIVYIRTEERESLYAAWNRGVKAARGKYLTNANTDDRHPSDALEKLVETLESHPEVALAYADSAVTDQENATWESAPLVGYFRFPEFEARLLFQVCYVGPHPLWRRELHGRYGLFDPAFTSAGDYEFWLRLAVTEQFLHVPEVLGLYLWAPGGLEHGQQNISHRESEEARQRHWPPAWGPRPPVSGNFLVPLTASPPESENWPVARARAAKKDISCVLTLHAEGLIAHKTIRSINRAVKYAEQCGLVTELLIVLDLATSETRRYVETSSIIDPAAGIISTDFGDCGLARNAGIEQACGEYVAIIDGDDLISENWLVRAHEVNQLSHGYVVHPEVVVCFDQKNELFYPPDQHQEDFDESNLIIENYWTVLSFSRRETYLLNPYRAMPALSGYGFEDWHWNCEVMARGFVHKTAPGTAFFYRVKEMGGINAEATARNALIPHSALFDNFGSRSIQENGVFAPTPALSGATESLNKDQRAAMLDKMVGALISRLPMRIRRAIFSAKMPPDWDEERYLSYHPDVKAAVENSIMSSGFEHWVRHGRAEGRRLAGAKIPKWLSDEMLALSDIEAKLFPSRTFFETATECRAMRANEAGPGPLYIQLLEETGDQSFTHVFLLPSLEPGGAELVALHHIRTLASEFGAQILVVLTEDTDSPWLQRLPESVTTLHFGRASSRLDPSQAQIVLARLLLKVHPAIIHNINSAIGWQVFCKYGAALCSESRLYVSLFWFDYTIEQEPVGYPRELDKAHAYLSSILTDNQRFADKLMELYGFRDNLFSVLRYPVHVVPRFTYFDNDRQPKILWAGRLVRAKRPDILHKIAESLPDCIFHVYGDSLLERSSEIAQTYEALRKMKNVTLFGSYAGFDAIPTDNYALFLYTSQWDGMPNVVLEALASGLAVLAPDVGGIREVIPSDSGFLIDRCDDVQAYVEAIRRVIANPQLIFAEHDKRLKLLREQYSPEAFIASLASMPLYTLTEACSRT
ncbi:MAG: glycosyltransferase [Geobacteraceae bacterium]